MGHEDETLNDDNGRTREEGNEQALIRAACGGDEQAFRQLVRLHEGTVAATAVAMLDAGDEAEDVAQEAMIRLHDALGDFKGEASLKTWLTRITMNLAIDALRRRKRQALWLWFKPDDQLATIAAPGGEERWTARQAINHAFLQLKPEQRAVATLRLIQGYSTDDTAAILGLPQGTVLSRLARARRQLAILLGDFIDE